jgi:hypothetical protein
MTPHASSSRLSCSVIRRTKSVRAQDRYRGSSSLSRTAAAAISMLGTELLTRIAS